jgi:chitodextrinase
MQLCVSERLAAWTRTTRSAPARPSNQLPKILRAIILSALGAIVFGAVGPTQVGRATPTGLVAAFSFDEGSGSVVGDVSGNGNNGSVANASWVAGKYGGALSFDGSSARVTVPDSASLHLTSAMTLEAWVDPATTTAAWRDVIYKGDDNYYLEGTSDRGGVPAAGAIFAGGKGHAYGPSVLPANAWSYLALTYDGAALRLYVNGSLVSSQANTGSIATSSNPLQIGGDSIYGQYFAGLIDEVRVYSTALTAAQIQTDMSTPVAGGAQDTTPPSTPSGLSTTAAQTSITLSWAASSDNVGVTGYRLYQNGSQVGTSSSTSYVFSGLSCATSYTLGVAAVDAAGNVSGTATTTRQTAACADTTPPSAPGPLTASGVSSSEIDLSWGSATDDVGVTGYQIFRCQGSGCANFAQVAQTAGTSYQDTGLGAATTYVYEVRATDAAGNLGPMSSRASATTRAAGSAGLVAAFSFDEGSGSVVGDVSGNGNNGSVANASWVAGKYGGALSFDGSSARVTVPDSASLHLTSAMTLEAWVDPATTTAAWRDVIYKGDDNYYLEGTSDRGGVPAAGAIFAGGKGHAYGPSVLPANAWSYLALTYDGAALRLYVNGSLVSSQANTGSIATSSNPLQIGGDSIYGQYFAGLIDEVRVYSTALTAAQIQTDMSTPVAGGAQDTTPPSTPSGLSTTAAQTSITLSWAASSDNVGVTGYRLYQNGSQVGTSSSTSYVFSGLSCATSYTLGVAAVDAAGNVSGTATTSGTTSACSSGGGPSYPLKVSANGRYLVDQNSTPFLLVGDSPQSLIGNLTEAQASTYFADRQAHGFNTVWINLLCTSYTYCNSDGTTFDGIRPFTTGTSLSDYDLSTPNPAYFQRVDDMINLAAQHGLVVFLDPIETGGWGGVLASNGDTKDFNYGAYLGARYKNFPNIVWLSGNDFQNWSDAAPADAVNQVMQGIHSTDPNHLQTIELSYNPDSTSLDSTSFPLTTLNAAYTYDPVYDEVRHGYNQSPTMPVFLVEANYEFENNTSKDPSTPEILRMQEYWTMLSGGTGQIYGNFYTVRTTTAASDWQSAAHIDTTGVAQLQYATAFFQSYPWYNLVPDQNNSVLTAGYGTYASTGAMHTNDYATAARVPDGSLVIVYTPTVRALTIDMTKLSGSVTARWFDPTNGTYTSVAGSPFANSGSRQFTPPGNNAEGSGDWLLVLTS